VSKSAKNLCFFSQISLQKAIIFFACIAALVSAAPAPKADPQFLAAAPLAYASPYTAAYSSPVVYSGYAASPYSLGYNSAYSAYPYSAYPYVF
jgi:hypothetical protein